jgi:hypothetical protein
LAGSPVIAIAIPRGFTTPPPSPWSTRAATRLGGSQAQAAASEPTAKTSIAAT